MPKRKAKTQTQEDQQSVKKRLKSDSSPLDRLGHSNLDCKEYCELPYGISSVDTINTSFTNFISGINVDLTAGFDLCCLTETCKQHKTNVKKALSNIIKNLKEGTDIIKPDMTYFTTQSTPFKFKSERNQQKKYEIKFELNGKLGCNCGIQFGQPIRGHCKHISSIIREIIHKFYEKALMHGYCEHELTIIHNICYHYIQSCSSLKKKKTKKMKKVRFTLPKKSSTDKEKVDELIKMIGSIVM